ncbi:MAG: HAD-IIB family hydrolase [Nitrospirae bacterium]|nr:HAD-IIB family hydrolase [Nitrospirota bacterium]MCL5423245.1 HAD-IIB family hydrolase [Nitrospirota bacterium]
MKQIIIFTDLDGTLLDHFTYSFDAALPALRLLADKDIPLVICSSKTRKEIEYYRKKLDNEHPFISENGGGIFIPKDYFAFRIDGPPFNVAEENSYEVIRLGTGYPDLRNALESLRKEGFDVKGFGDMTVEEVAEIAGMRIDEAMMAKERDFDEPFIFEGNDQAAQKLVEAIEAKGFTCTEGRFFHILGNSDKGKAAAILTGLFKRGHGDITTVALGDSLNDLPMLEKADYPIIVQKAGARYESRIILPNLVRAEGIGPEGWNKTVLKLVSDLTGN